MRISYKGQDDKGEVFIGLAFPQFRISLRLFLIGNLGETDADNDTNQANHKSERNHVHNIPENGLGVNKQAFSNFS